ncbi:unnamed protein product [Camellia sinensis]
MIVGLAMLLLSPFLVIFMLVYLFLRHAEQFYNQLSTASSRRWSNLSKWMFREFNEVWKSTNHTQSTDGKHGRTNHPISDVNLRSGEMMWNSNSRR